MRTSTTKSKLIVAVALLCLVIGIALWLRFRGPATEQLVADAMEACAAGNAAKAEELAWQAWKQDTKLEDAAMFAAEMAHSQGRLQQALEYSSQISTSDSQLYLQALRLRATIFSAQLQLVDAEKAFRAILQDVPDDPQSCVGLAKLLATCGRRQEATPLVINLIASGQATDLVMLLSRPGAVNEVEKLQAASQSDQADPLSLLGLAWHAANAANYDEAIKLSRQALNQQSDLLPAQLALGKYLFEKGDAQELLRWESSLGKYRSDAQAFADYWQCLGFLAEGQAQSTGAIRCYLEAVKRSPESKFCIVKLVQLLDQAQLPELAKRFSQFSALLQELTQKQDQVFFSPGSQNENQMLQMMNSLESLGRNWESLGWCRLAILQNPNSRILRDRYSQLATQSPTWSKQQFQEQDLPTYNISFEQFSLPQLNQSLAKPAANTDERLSDLRFQMRDEASSTGLDFRFFSGSNTPNHHMYEFTGGGIGVVDYNNDGWPDIFFTQGTKWPPETEGELTDSLYRNIDGGKFAPTNAFKLAEDGFGQGIAVADYDGDGFSDIYIAQIGQNRLLHNNGDATFTDVTDSSGLISTAWTTSCVIADLNGDHLPDIYDVNYVEAPDLFERVCRDSLGGPLICMPFDFAGARDALWINDGQGSFRNESETLSTDPVGKGLGVLAADLDQSGRVGLVIANDTTANFWFVPSTEGKLQERGLASGLAFNGEGKPEGSMGIASEDVNNDGLLDLVVTNFYNEPDTLYVNKGQGYFSDETKARGLFYPTLNVLGFGIQFIDIDCDGQTEMVVANGHIDDMRPNNRPFEMEPQLFRVVNGRFYLVGVSSSPEYFSNKYVGRSIAKVDWNRDGREDLVIGHIYSPYALLSNTTSGGKVARIRLVGRTSNRDAIGAQLTARIGNRTVVKQVLAGDGYQASNERIVSICAVNSEKIDSLEIRWPSGIVQLLSDLQLQENTIVEPRN